MADKNLLQLPLAITASGALLYGIQDNTDKAFPASVLQGSEQPQGANLVFAGPPTAPGTFPTFRPLVQADIPDLSSLYLASNGGTLVGATINNSTIVGGNISGATAAWDDDKFTVRNVTDTTKVIRFNASTISAGQTRIFTWPDANGQVVTDNASQNIINKSVFLRASGSAAATFRIPHGQAPSSPVNGDMWTTNAGLYVQANNATIGPLAAAASSTVTTFNGRQGAVTLSSLDVTNALGFSPYNPALNSYVQKSGDVMSGNLTAPAFFDSFGNIRSALLAVDANANSRVSKSGDTMTGALVIGTGGGGQLWLQDTAAGSHYMRLGAGLRTLGDGISWFLSDTYTFEFVGPTAAKMFEVNNAVARHTTRIEVGTNKIAMVAAESGRTGFLEFRQEDGTRAAFIGYSVPGGRVNCAVDGGATGWDFTGTMNVSGVVTAGGGFGPTSDPRLKDTSSLKSVDNALEKVYNLNVRYGKYHDWHNADGKERVFLMADEALESNVPQAVIDDAAEHNGEKYKGWSADQIIALLVKAVQELTDKVKELEEKNNG